MRDLREDPVFHDLFDISPPWKVELTSFSERQRTVRLRIDYDGERMTCPICGVAVSVKGTETVAWKASGLFHYKTHVTAAIPVLAHHNDACRGDRDDSVLLNTLLLDLLVKQDTEPRLKSPLYYLFHAVHVSPPQSKRQVQ